MKQLRTNVTMVGMGYRLTTIFSQIGGFSDSTAELGPAVDGLGLQGLCCASFGQHRVRARQIGRDAAPGGHARP